MKMTLEEAIRQIIDSYMHNVHTALPAVITHYDAKTQNAFVQPLVKQVYFNGKVVSLPVIVNVPIVFPHNKKCGLKFPLQVGDTVLAIFSEACLERWLSSKGEEVEMGYNRRFDLSDAIAIPCLFPIASDSQFGSDDEQASVVLLYNGAKIILKEDGSVQIKSKDNATLNLNNSAIELKNNADSLLNILSDLAQDLYNATIQGHYFDNRSVYQSIKSRIESLKG